MFVLESKPEAVCRIEEFVRSVADQYKISEELYSDILITLTEAVNNAILHGNKEDCNKFVNIHIKSKEGVLNIFVEDQGAGFDPDCVEDPTSPENIKKCGGRGVFLIKEICDSVRFHKNGSVVQLCFKL